MRGEPRAVWQDRVEHWRRSGLTAEEFARTEGIQAATLRHWKWQLAAQGSGRREARGHRGGFVELVVPGPRERDDGFEVMLADGIRVRVPSAFDGEALGRLLSILEERGI